MIEKVTISATCSACTTSSAQVDKALRCEQTLSTVQTEPVRSPGSLLHDSEARRACRCCRYSKRDMLKLFHRLCQQQQLQHWDVDAAQSGVFRRVRARLGLSDEHVWGTYLKLRELRSPSCVVEDSSPRVLLVCCVVLLELCDSPPSIVVQYIARYSRRCCVNWDFISGHGSDGNVIVQNVESCLGHWLRNTASRLWQLRSSSSAKPLVLYW